MIFDNQNVLEQFRGKLRCEWCGKAGPTDPAHLFARGRGNGFQMDIPENLVALCRICHSNQHNGGIPLRGLLLAVAEREGLWVDDLDQILRRLRWAKPKEWPKEYGCGWPAENEGTGG